MSHKAQRGIDMAIRILRDPIVWERKGTGRSTTYKEIADGLWPPRVRLGPRAVGTPEHEADAVIAARVAGKSDDEIRALVAQLVKKRANASP